MRAMETVVTREAREDTIDKAAAILEMALHTHPARRAAILREILASIRSALLEGAHGAYDPASPLVQLEAFFRAYIRLVRAHPDILRTLRASKMRQPTFRLLIRIEYEGFLEWIRETIAEGARTGSIRNDLHSRLLALMFAGVLEAFTTRWLLSNCALPLEEPAGAAWEGLRAILVSSADGSRDLQANKPHGKQ